MALLRYFPPFLFLATVPLGYAMGGAWTFLTVLAVPIALVTLDGFLGEAQGEESATRPASRLLPWAYIPAQLLVTGWAAVIVSRPGTPLVSAVGLTLSVGMTAGIFGMLAAHEMVHSPRPAERGAGLAMLASVGYMHFRIAHLHGHHVHAATAEDPATARLGESAYRFVVRSVAGQFVEAWRFEGERLRRRGLPVFGPANRVIVYVAVESALLAVAVAVGGPRLLAFALAQAAVAVALLELFNYVAHYGLVRRRLADGRLERLGPEHAWNSARRMNNASLFNMGRHSDHHRAPTRRYEALAAVDGAPELPFGYAGAVLTALAPGLWRRTMDPRVAMLAGGANGWRTRQDSNL